MNQSLTIVLLGQAGVGKSFVGNNLHYYLYNNIILDPNSNYEQKFLETFQPQTQVLKQQVIQHQTWFCKDQIQIQIIETVSIGQIIGMSRNESCRYIIQDIRNNYQNVKYVIVFHREKQLDGDNLKDFFHYIDALQDNRQDVIVFLNKRSLKNKEIEEYILNSYKNQQQYFGYLAQTMSDLCNTLFIGYKVQNQHNIQQKYSDEIQPNDQQQPQPNNQKQLNVQNQLKVEQQQNIHSSQEKGNLITENYPRILYLYSVGILSKQIIEQLYNCNILTLQNQIQTHNQVNLILINLHSLQNIIYNKQKKLLISLKEQSFSKNIILYFSRKKEISYDVEEIIMQNKFKLLKEESVDSIVSWMEITPQPANLNEVLKFLNSFF